jgi:hypothetical protein
MSLKSYLVGLMLLTFSGCIGTDYVDDPLSTQINEKIVIDPADTSLLVGAKFQFRADYFNKLGIIESKTFTWTISNSEIAEIDQFGEVTAKKPGQVRITATTESLSSEMALLTIVENIENVATVRINGVIKLYTSETKLLNAEVLNNAGELINSPEIIWSSDNSSIASIDGSGKITALNQGSVGITATVDGIKSLPHRVEILPTRLSASIVQGTVPGDRANGTATLIYSNERLILNLEDNFITSNGPSLFVYLSNCNALTSSNLNTCEKLELAPLKSISGTQSYELPSGVYINDYEHVIIFCKPFVVTFGSGMFK